ncbi:unnamed protein product [Ectocarpus sp. 12 AP-2014]
MIARVMAPWILSSGLVLYADWHAEMCPVEGSPSYSSPAPAASNILTAARLLNVAAMARMGKPSTLDCAQYLRLDSASTDGNTCRIAHEVCFWTARHKAGGLSTPPNASTRSLVPSSTRITDSCPFAVAVVRGQGIPLLVAPADSRQETACACPNSEALHKGVIPPFVARFTVDGAIHGISFQIGVVQRKVSDVVFNCRVCPRFQQFLHDNRAEPVFRCPARE